MYHQPQSTFLIAMSKTAQDFARASYDIELDLTMKKEVSAQLTLDNCNDKFPNAMKWLRATFIGFIMSEDLTSPYITTPISAFAAFFSPIPGDGMIHAANAYRGASKIYDGLKGQFNGDYRRSEIDKVLLALRQIDSKDNAIEIDPITYSQH